MPMTLEQIRNQLSAIEPNDGTYSGIGPSEIPFVEQLLHDKEAWMASRAIFALSKIPDAKAVTILSKAAVADPRPEVRVAIAASAGNLTLKDANNILMHLLADNELGVRKFAIKSVSIDHDISVHEKLKYIKMQDSELLIRNLAKDRLREITAE